MTGSITKKPARGLSRCLRLWSPLKLLLAGGRLDSRWGSGFSSWPVNIAILGAGAWGTALANVLARNGAQVRLHGWRREHMARLSAERENSAFLPGVPLAESIHPTSDYGEALSGAQWVLLVVPTQSLRATLEAARADLPGAARLISACKGIEVASLKLVHELVEEVLGPEAARRTVHLSGPSFAREVAAQEPTNLVAAARDHELCAAAQTLLSSERLRVYTSDDPVGVELGGALKNVMAIAAGACAGLGFGFNAQAALVTRGLAEMTRLAVALGGQPQTLAGLSGLGDLILSTSYPVSRNRELGFEVGRGREISAVLGGLHGVAEGYATAKAVHRLAEARSVELPIAEEVYQVLYEGKPVLCAVSDLLARPLKKEWG